MGVVDANGRHQVISSGPLPEAVAASAAIPVVFENVHVPGSHGHANPFMDGGVVDRVGLKAWRQRRREQARQQQQGRGGGGRGSRENGVEGEGEECWLPPCLVHVIERSSTFSGDDDVEASGETRIQVRPHAMSCHVMSSTPAMSFHAVTHSHEPSMCGRTLCI